jgi:enoyl-CoA hydratase/carnithine racemase
MLVIEAADGIHTLTIDRASQRNALDDATLDEILDALASARAAGARAIVLTGAGSQAFSAGSDIKEMAGQTPEQRLEHTALGQRVAAAIEAHPAPVLAAIDGYCLGGGLEIALACDLRIAGAGAVFGLPELQISALPAWGGTYRLGRAVGIARAKELALFGRRISAQEAREWGLVAEVAEDGGAVPRATAIARGFESIEPRTTARLKALLNLGQDAGAAVAGHLEMLADEIQTATPAFDEQAAAFSRPR